MITPNNKANKIVNWTEVSRVLTNNANEKQIRSTYRGKRYKRQVNGLKRLINFWLKWI